MKRAQNNASKSQKRTQALIHLLENKHANNQSIANTNPDADADMDASDKCRKQEILITDLNAIAEDLIDDSVPEVKGEDNANSSSTVTINSNTLNNPPSKAASITQSIELFYALIKKECAKAAQQLQIDQQELQAWIDLQIEVPAKTILTLLRTMQRLHLDPLCDEIGFTQYEDGAWQAIITIEGCAKLLNQHTQFEGLSFNQSETLIDGIPEWIECAIYRKDRVIPTITREYLVEVRSDKEIWQKMPRRMLRHRALQQCVRLAFTQ